MAILLILQQFSSLALAQSLQTTSASSASSVETLEAIEIGSSRIETGKKPVYQKKTKELSPALRPSLDSAFQTDTHIQVTPTPQKGTTLSINGFSGEHVSLLNNIDPILGRIDGSVDVRSILLDGIENISEYRGFDALSFGSQNIAGVISLESPWRLERDFFRARAAGGSLGRSFFNFTGSYAGRGKNQAILGASSARGDAYRVEPSEASTTLDAFARQGGSATFISREVGLLLSEPLDFRIGVNGSRENIKGIFSDEDTNTNQNRIYVFGDLKRKASVFHLSYQRFHRKTDGFGANTYEESSYRAGPEFSEKLNKDTTLLVGSVIDIRDTRSTRMTTDRAGQDLLTRTNIGSYLGLKQIYKADWVFGAGSRYDTVPGVFSPKAEIKRLFASENFDHEITLGAYWGFREATAKERFYDFSNSALRYRVVGNPNLNSEKSFTPTVAYELKKERYLFKAHGQILYLDDAILYVAQNPALRNGVFTYENVGQTRTFSLSFDNAWNFYKNFNFVSGYQWLSGRNLDNGGELFLQPGHRVSTGIALNQERGFSGSAFALWTSKQGFFDLNRNFVVDADEWAKAFWSVQFELGYGFKLWSIRNARFFSRVENAINVSRKETFPVEPRTFIAGAQIEL